MRAPFSLETQCARSSEEKEGMMRLGNLVRDVSRRVVGCSQVSTICRKVDFGGLEYHEFEMEEELAARTVVKRIGPRTGPTIPIAKTLE